MAQERSQLSACQRQLAKAHAHVTSAEELAEERASEVSDLTAALQRAEGDKATAAAALQRSEGEKAAAAAALQRADANKTAAAAQLAAAKVIFLLSYMENAEEHFGAKCVAESNVKVFSRSNVALNP